MEDCPRQDTSPALQGALDTRSNLEMYEFTAVIGYRAKMISDGSPCCLSQCELDTLQVSFTRAHFECIFSVPTDPPP